MAALAPSSPRLPSPPPPAEIQLGPKSPSMGAAASRQAQQMEHSINTALAKRRIHPGTRAADFAAGPPLVPLNELDSAFQLQEHLAALHYFHSDNGTQPINRDTAATLASPPPGTDRTLWLYELCRFLIAQCNSLIVGFLFDTPPCSAATCPEMRASEWQFLCAVHDSPKSCCAIDYCCHTLDWAANVVTNPKLFPSRFSLSEGHDKTSAVKNLVNVFRRLHRIFAHAWFQHRGVFWSVEGQTGLYVLFKTVCDMYDLLPAENYKLPPEAEGLEMASSHPTELERKTHGSSGPATATTTAPTGHTRVGSVQRGGGGISEGTETDDYLQPVGRTNTRRHIRSSPSTGSAVTTVMEQDEDDGPDGVAGRLSEMHISAASPSPPPPPAAPTVPGVLPEEDEEAEMAEVPVIVEHDMMVDEVPEPEAQPDEPKVETEAPAAAAAAAEEPSSIQPEPEPEPEAKVAEDKATSPEGDITPVDPGHENEEPAKTADETERGGEAATKEGSDPSETSTHDHAVAAEEKPAPPPPAAAEEKAEVEDEGEKAKAGEEPSETKEE